VKASPKRLPARARGSAFSATTHRLDSERSGIRCIRLNKLAMPGDAVVVTHHLPA
jgi:hypothetical protein